MGKQKDKNIVVGLDIGTTKVCAVIAKQNEKGEQSVIGIGISPSNGLKKGIVVNIENTVESIIKAVEEAENMASVQIDSVFAGIAGSHIKSFSNKGIIPIAHDDREITAADMQRAVSSAEAISVPLDREVIHTIAQEYIVDGQEGIKDPQGMYGMRLEAKVHVVTAAVTAAQNMVKCVETAGFAIEDIVLEPLASSIATLTEEEKQSGVVMIDIGGGTTDIIVYAGGIIRHAEVLAVGGENVTNDISIGLKIPMIKAEETKKRFGCALMDQVDQSEEFMVPGIIGRQSDTMTRKYLAEIIQMRMQEIYMLVKREVKKSGFAEQIAAGVVITGGASLLERNVDLAQRIFNVPVRIGKPRNIAGLVEVLDSPIYATGVGLAQYGFDFKANNLESELKGRNMFAKVFHRMKHLYGEYF